MISALLLGQISQPAQWTNPIQMVREIPGAAAAIETLAPGESRLEQEGNTLTFYYRQKTAPPLLVNMVGLQLSAIPGTDGWALRAKFPDVDHLVMSYLFVEGQTRRLRKPLQVFRGKRAPQWPNPLPELKGRITKHSFKSENLESPREIEVYFPPRSMWRVPVVYMADGQGLAGAAAQIERLILDGVIEPVALVGVHSGGYLGGEGEYDPQKDLRAREYLRAFDEEAYEGHLKFFCDEVRQFVEGHYNVRRDRAGRVVTGFSNGGAFAFTAGLDRAEMFGSVFAYSVAAFTDEQVRASYDGQQLPKFSFSAGELEPFIRGTRRADGLVREFGGVSELRTYQAGHDPAMWNYTLGEDLRRTFPKTIWEKCF